MRKLFRLGISIFVTSSGAARFFVTSVTERWGEPLVLRFDPPMVAGAWCKRP